MDWRKLYDKGASFFKRLHLKRIWGQTNKYWFSFYVPVGCKIFTSHVQFESDALIIACQQHDQNICCLSSLDSDLKKSNKLSAENETTTMIYY